MFISFCANPAEKIPAGLVPCICTISLVFSLHPVAIITALAFTVSNLPGLKNVTVLSGVNLTAIDFKLTSIPGILLTLLINLSAYSGPVKTSLK